MKLSLILLFLTFSFGGQCMDVLVTYFDPFDGREINNSEVVALELKSTFKDESINLHFCQLRTVFDKAFAEIQDCISEMESKPSMVISLGESGCYGVKIETRALNYDKSFGPDNDGIERNGTEIYSGEAKALGVTLPVQKGYCALTSAQKKMTYISNTAGSFVCNNTLYHLLRNLDIPSTFIHVSTRSCTRKPSDIKVMASIVGDMISAMKSEPQELISQPASKEETKTILRSELNSCEKNFYQILKREY